jgi:hypothetical protein
MKKCTWCGQEYPDDATVCSVDNEPLASSVPSDENLRNPLFERRVGISGCIQNRFGYGGDIQDSFAKIYLASSHLRLETFGGPYIIQFKSITSLRRRLIFSWVIRWEDSSSSGELMIGGLGSFIEHIRKGMNDADDSEGQLAKPPPLNNK